MLNFDASLIVNNNYEDEQTSEAPNRSESSDLGEPL